MRNTLFYKGYQGSVEYSAEDGVLYGEIEGIRDLVTFESASVDEIEQAFRDSVDEYLLFCAQAGKPPETDCRESLQVM